MRANKGKSLMQVLKMAKKTYKGKSASKKTRRGGGMVLQPAIAGGRRGRKGTRRSRRGGMDY
jgi:hypothetical protein